jgi:hypothetical protein
MPLVSRDDLNRIAKAAVDRGEVATYEEALALFRSYRFSVVVGDDVEHDPQLQTALLTIANAGPRAFLGGVDVAGKTDAILSVPWAKSTSIAETVTAFGCKVVDELSPGHPIVVLGTPSEPPAGDIVVYVRVSGWRGGVTVDAPFELPPAPVFAPAASLAGAIAVSEVFQHVRGNQLAGRRTTGLSLWRPELDWTDDEAAGEAVAYLPSGWWLLGLGHLGQANAWTIALLPYPDPTAVEVMLQDRDRIVPANEATSMLLDADALREMKTRLVSRRLEQLGLRTRVVERLFDEHQRLQATEPTVALAGFDNPQARRQLSEGGYSLVVDAGLGGDPESYLDVMLHSFPSSRRSNEVELWKARPRGAQGLVDSNDAYRRMVEESGDECGVLDIAGASVATAFVGCTAAALAVAEVCRAVAGGPQYEVIDLSLKNPGRVRVAEIAEPMPYAGAFVKA